MEKRRIMMFFRKTERKKCHPCLTVGICALTAVGVIAIMNKSKCVIKEKMQAMVKFVKNGCKCTCECEDK